jgi:Protein of unknown function (DUF4065)
MPNDMQFDRQKLKAVILYICSKCSPEQLGAVKLHKVLYFSDMLRYLQTRHALIGAEYRKRPFGPTCVQLLPTLTEMVSAGEIVVRESNYFGYRKTEYEARKNVPHGTIAADEIELLDEVIEFVCARNSARSISDYSHQAPWERADYGGLIPYSTAYMLLPSIVSEEAFRVTAEGLKDVEKARQDGNAVVFTDFAEFRRRVREKDGSLSS